MPIIKRKTRSTAIFGKTSFLYLNLLFLFSVTLNLLKDDLKKVFFICLGELSQPHDI